MPEILGRLRPPRLAAAPASPAVGEMYFNTATSKLYWWSGSAWVDASGGGGGVPSGAAGGDLYGSYPNPGVLKHSFPDTRAVATTPADYTVNGKWQFKERAAIGNPGGGGAYCALYGLRAWTDDTGGRAHEFAYTDAGTYYRNGTNAGGWGLWREVVRADGDLNVAGTLRSLNGYVIAQAMAAGDWGTLLAISGSAGAPAGAMVGLRQRGDATTTADAWDMWVNVDDPSYPGLRFFSYNLNDDALVLKDDGSAQVKGALTASNIPEVHVQPATPSPRTGTLWVDTDEASGGAFHRPPAGGIARTMNMGVSTVALPAFTASSMIAVVSGPITHNLGVQPTGGWAQVFPGAGDRLGSVPIGNIESMTPTTMTCRHHNASNPLIAIGAGTVTIAWMVWA